MAEFKKVALYYEYFTFKENEDGQTVTLTDYDPSLSDSTDITIPATVDLVDGVWQDGTTYTVTAIASAITSSSGVFYNSGITSITFPETLENIGNYAFYRCSGLTSISLPSSLKAIGSYAFSYCSGLTGELDFSNCTSLTSIGRSAFRDCRKLTSVDLSGCTSLTSIGSWAFNGCGALELVVFPEGSTGWYVTTSATVTSGTPVDVTNSSTNSSNLTGQYYNYYWKRNG